MLEITTTNQVREDLLEFGRRVTREICVRAAGHAPADAEERRWRMEGAVSPRDLDCIKGTGLISENQF